MSSARALVIAALASTLTAACGPAETSVDAGVDAGLDASADAAPPTCAAGFVGDAAKDPELVVTAIGAEPVAKEVTLGSVVPLIFPPQGGRVIFAGARVTNIDACGVTLTGALRDLSTKQVRVDARTVNLIAAADGSAESDPTDISSFSNIPVCPNQWASADIFGVEYELEIVVVDRGGRSVSKKLKVTPECAEPEREAECRCICKGGYMLGEVCMDAMDGGAGGSGGGG